MILLPLLATTFISLWGRAAKGLNSFHQPKSLDGTKFGGKIMSNLTKKIVSTKENLFEFFPFIFHFLKIS